MVRSLEIIEKIQQTLPKEDWLLVDPLFNDLQSQQLRRARKTFISEINGIIIETSLKNNKPSMLLALPDIPSNEIDDLFSKVAKQFITTQEKEWLEIIFSLSEKLGKKSNQSRVFAMIARDLIDAGVSESNPRLIDTGMVMLNRISFRKYRSDIMIDIIPLLIVWTITTRDQALLYISLNLIEEIGDISKRAVLHAELAKALATIAILENNRTLFFGSIQSAAEIHQKIRRQRCISVIIEKGAKAIFGKEMVDIPQFMNNFKDISNDAQLEIISALTEQLLEREKDKNQILTILQILCEKKPLVTSTLVIDLLKKAERSGDFWFLSSAMELMHRNPTSGVYPIREMVRAASSVAKVSNNMRVLSDLIPIIDNNCNPMVLSRIYLQFSQIMLSCGDFSSAMDLFGKIRYEQENIVQYSENLTLLLKEGFFQDSLPVINKSILIHLPEDVANSVVYRAAIDLSKETSFEDLIGHIQSIHDLILLHPRQDSLFLECITILGDRGFLNYHDPSILIRLAESISDQHLKERAISNIVIKIAKIGVLSKNRDYLQRAVGLTCEIDGQNTRSATLSSIIDEASILAAQQGDLDLLLRMRIWSSSLLEKDLAAYAMANIIDGIIKYAIDRHSPEALEEAYLIAKEINDPALRTQLFERITECFVKIGCILLGEPQDPINGRNFLSAQKPFERGLEIIKQNIKSPQISLKIAGIIDIIIDYSHSSNNPDYIIPLAMYAVEIENSYERDAMMSRIISSLSDDITHPNSTDPYEIMAYLLQKNEISKSDPVIIKLISHILQLITNSYVRLTGLSNLAESSLQLHDYVHSKQILEEIYLNIPNLPAEYQKVLMLSDLAILFCQIDTKIAADCLSQGIQKLGNVEYDREAVARRQIVFAIVRLNTIAPDPELIGTALRIVEKISEPAEYINSLMAVYSMVRNDKSRCNELLHFMADAADRISSPYERATALLDIVPLALQNYDDDTPLNLLRKAEILTKKINIQYIADKIRNSITQLYSILYQKYNDKKYLTHAISVIKSIDDVDVRLNHLTRLGQSENYEILPQYIKIKSLSEKMMQEGIHTNQIVVLERLIRTVADRGREAIFFCDLAIFFRRNGEDKLSKRMMQSAIKEARIIRPLSRRAFVMCDIALKINAAGCEQMAQEVLDFAIDAATNIRQSSLRDEVFDELGLAIKLMQGM
jgi:hypothetical protein